jgi:DNA-binding response OmpR family regulator
MEDEFHIFILTEELDREIDYLLTGLNQPKFIVHQARNISDALLLLDDIVPDCLLFDHRFFSVYRHDIFSKIEETEKLQGVPIGIIAGIENSETYCRLLKFGVADIIVSRFRGNFLLLE